MVDEGRALLASTENVTRWQGIIATRQSAKDTEPPLA